MDMHMVSKGIVGGCTVERMTPVLVQDNHNFVKPRTALSVPLV